MHVYFVLVCGCVYSTGCELTFCGRHTELYRRPPCVRARALGSGPAAA